MSEQLRDKIAIEAMKILMELQLRDTPTFNDWEYVSDDAYRIADEMINTRQKNKGENISRYEIMNMNIMDFIYEYMPWFNRRETLKANAKEKHVEWIYKHGDTIRNFGPKSLKEIRERADEVISNNS